MKLRELLQNVPNIPPSLDSGVLEAEVKGLCTNSQTCQEGDLFIGLPGTRVDGGEFWSSAIAKGAIAAIISPEVLQKHPPQGDSPLIEVEDIIIVCAQIAATFYHRPGEKLKLVGVTGTNGKTTTTHLIEYFLREANLATALFGTLYTRWQGYEKVALHTTPFALDLQQQLGEAVAAGSKYGVMEVSSHALSQHRVQECPFEVAVFTNLTQDHLDFHKDMEDYFQAKAQLFSPEYLKGRAIINLDDPYGKRLIEEASQPVWTYSVSNQEADLWTEDLNYQPTGVRGTVHTPVGEMQFNSPLVGQFNLANLLAAVGAGLHLGLALKTMLDPLSRFSGVPGRMERVEVDPQQDITVIVDYAHTPDSLENMLKAARPFIAGKMICVFGCGGDRDRGKRPQMGKIAADLADISVVTSDNPRTEDPQKILEDILAGMPRGIAKIVERDRAKAIEQAIATAQPGDGILIAGKGHEDYQILGTEKIHFDDREEARKALEARKAS